jgi:ABC-type Fe3+-hydroxamate transport system substrate-binding protein
MLVALGEEGNLVATGYQNNFFDGFYNELNGIQVNIDPTRLTYLSHAGGGMFDKEVLYSLHPDIFHIDPVQLASSRGWSRADVDEISRNVAPFFANRYSRENTYSGKEPYTFYTIWELSKKVGEVYQRPERMTQLKLIYDQLVRDIQAKLPPVEKRPRVGLIFYNNGKFVPYSLLRGGFGQAQYRDVGARDAFADIENKTYSEGSQNAPLDLEGLLAINPDVLIMPFAIYPASQSTTSRTGYEQLLKLKDDPLVQRLIAFLNGRVYPGGTPLQGPIFYLFQIEMAAKQIYPEIFGPYRDDQNYPPQEQLFDRSRVAAILQASAADSHDPH